MENGMTFMLEKKADVLLCSLRTFISLSSGKEMKLDNKKTWKPPNKSY